MRYADSLLVAWSVAAHEAAAAGAADVSPGHLLIGLCKVAQVDAGRITPVGPVATARELEELRSALAEMDIEPTAFRRRLRAQLAGAGPAAGHDPADLHRTPAARQAFRLAEAIAEREHADHLRPAHLLSGLLELDHPDWQRQLGQL